MDCEFCKAKIYIFKKYYYLCSPLKLSVAQPVEQLTLNQWVRGSSPRGETDIQD